MSRSYNGTYSRYISPSPRSPETKPPSPHRAPHPIKALFSARKATDQPNKRASTTQTITNEER